MFRAFWFLLLLAALSLGAALLADNPGQVSMQWLGYKIETSVSVLFTALFVLSFLLASAIRIWSFFRRAPRRIGRAHQDWRRQRGYKALTQGMVAVAAGDAMEARRLSRKAEALLAEPPLTMLLSAQAAQLSGDEKAAGKFFDAMAKQPETKYLGLSGKLKQAMEEGDQDSALELAEQASNLKPKTETATSTLLDLQIKKQDWEKAEKTVKKSIKNKTIDSTTGRRRRALMLFQRSLEEENNGKLADALSHAQQANNLAPDFVPAAIRTARLLQSAGKRRKAAAVIEEIWVSNPHPHLADVMGELASGAGPQEKMRMIERLAGYNKDHEESHLAIAKAALSASMWQEAREHLLAAAQRHSSARACRYMAELEEFENGDVNASREWLRRASVADPDSAWLCNECGNAVAEWEPVCSRCEKFDTLEWKMPPRVTRIDDEIASNPLDGSGQEIIQTLDAQSLPDHVDTVEQSAAPDQATSPNQKEK
ncbi:MAG: heme biosynthesis HemY N-terminal domain-containing protein [Rhodospirillales bacterium]|nr:heme biosynthesis HemY N-terminal domain-containing protein [Rhodospirillales bacterium]